MRQLAMLSLLLLTGIADAESAPVGPLTLEDLRVRVTGITTFAPMTVADALRIDTAVIAVANPFSERDDLLKALGERCALGYAACGFPHAETRAIITEDPEHRHLEIQITEGPRFRWGALRLTDTGPAGEAPLRVLLCTPRPHKSTAARKDLNADPEPPLFVSGKPARFDRGWVDEVAAAVRGFYSDQGFLRCEPIVEISPGHDGIADCLVHLAEPLKATTIAGISVHGAERNGTPRILAWLEHGRGLKAGAPALASSIDAARRDMADSPCFLTSSIETVTHQDHPELVDLIVTVTEDADLPLLGEEPNPIQRTLLAVHAQALAALQAGEGDVELDFTGSAGAVRSHLNPQHGVIIAAKVGDAGSGSDLVCQADETGFALMSKRRKIRVSLPFPRPGLTIDMGTTARDPQGNRGNLTFMIGYTNKGQNPISIAMAPACFLLDSAKARLDGTRIRTDKDATSTCFFDPAGTPFLDLVIAGSKTSGQTQVRIGKRSWSDSVADLVGDGATYPLATGHRLPLLEALSFLVEEYLDQAEPADPARRAGLEIWWHAAADMIDSMARSWIADHPTDPDDADRYWIPLPPALQPQQIQIVTQAAVAMLLQTLHGTWKPDQWPSLVVREARDVLCGRSEHVSETLVALTQGDAMGPIGYGICAWLVGKLDAAAGRTIAVAGLSHVKVEGFSTDCLRLLGSPTAIRGLLAKIDDQASAAAALPAAWREAGLKLIADAKMARGDDDDRRIAIAATLLLWESGGSTLVERWLKLLATESTPARAGVPP